MGIYLVRRSPEKRVSVMGIHLGKPFWNKGSPSWESTWENPFRIKGFHRGNLLGYGTNLGPTCANMGQLGAFLGPTWGQLGPTWINLGRHGRTWNQLGANMGPTWRSMGQNGANLGSTWGSLGANLVQLRPTWVNLGST